MVQKKVRHCSHMQWGPSPAEMGTQKCILDKLTEMSLFREIKSVNLIFSDKQTQVFVILSSFCDLVHFQSVVHMFAKRLNIALNVH